MEHSIEILGQKFSYPSTWQGVSSVVAICLCIGFLGWALEPGQIDAYASGFKNKDNKVEDELIALNQKLNEEVVTLRSKVFELTKVPNIGKEEKEELLSKIEQNKKDINIRYEELIEAQSQKQKRIENIVPVSPQQQQILSLEKQRLNQQQGLFEMQQQIQLAR